MRTKNRNSDARVEPGRLARVDNRVNNCDDTRPDFRVSSYYESGRAFFDGHAIALNK